MSDDFNRYVSRVRSLGNRITYIKDVSSFYETFRDQHSHLLNLDECFEFLLVYTLERYHYLNVTRINDSFNLSSGILSVITRVPVTDAVLATSISRLSYNEYVYFFFDRDSLDMWLTVME